MIEPVGAVSVDIDRAGREGILAQRVRMVIDQVKTMTFTVSVPVAAKTLQVGSRLW